MRQGDQGLLFCKALMFTKETKAHCFAKQCVPRRPRPVDLQSIDVRQGDQGSLFCKALIITKETMVHCFAKQWSVSRRPRLTVYNPMMNTVEIEVWRLQPRDVQTDHSLLFAKQWTCKRPRLNVHKPTTTYIMKIKAHSLQTSQVDQDRYCSNLTQVLCTIATRHQKSTNLLGFSVCRHPILPIVPQEIFCLFFPKLMMFKTVYKTE